MLPQHDLLAVADEVHPPARPPGPRAETAPGWLIRLLRLYLLVALFCWYLLLSDQPPRLSRTLLIMGVGAVGALWRLLPEVVGRLLPATRARCSIISLIAAINTPMPWGVLVGLAWGARIQVISITLALGCGLIGLWSSRKELAVAGIAITLMAIVLAVLIVIIFTTLGLDPRVEP